MGRTNAFGRMSVRRSVTGTLQGGRGWPFFVPGIVRRGLRACQHTRLPPIFGEHVTTERIQAMVRRIIEQATLDVNGLADEAGISRASLYAWADGRRNPTPENLARLADALDRRSGELAALADELRKAGG